MAVILQKSTQKHRGLLVLSHREKKLFDYLSIAFPSIITAIKSKYIIVMHIGWVLDDFIDYDYIDTVFCADGNIKDISKITKKIIPLSSREFIPKIFNYDNEKKDIDITIITNAAKHKRPYKIVKLAQELIKESNTFKSFFMVTYPTKIIKSKFDHSLEERFWKSIPLSKRNFFSFLSVKATNGLYPLPRWFIAKIYKSSKYYLHTCEKEGESRAIGEALLAQCIVLLPSNMQGAAYNLAKENPNCYFYSSVEEAKNIIIEDKYIFKEPYFSIHMDKAKEVFYDFYQKYSLGNKKEFDEIFLNYDLSMALPGHIQPQYLQYNQNYMTADIDSYFKLISLLSYLDIDIKITLIDRFKIGTYFLLQTFLSTIKNRLVSIRDLIYDKV